MTPAPPLLRDHLDSVEGRLLAEGAIPDIGGHSSHKGTPRESFVRTFLEQHLGENLAIGTGEVICATSKRRERRPQLDVVIYRRGYPRIALGGGIHAFLAESVLATIEVKTKLTKSELRKSILSAQKVKQVSKTLDRDSLILCGPNPPSILNYIVAYQSTTTSVKRVLKSIVDIHVERNIPIPTLPVPRQERYKIASPTIDGIFVLGKAFALFDNIPLGLISEEMCKEEPYFQWWGVDTKRGALFFLFLLLAHASSGVPWVFNPVPYAVGAPIGHPVHSAGWITPAADVSEASASPLTNK